MKKIYRFLLTAAALFAVAPAVFAQTPGTYSINGQIQETVTDPETGTTTVKYLEWPKAAENGLQQPEGTDFAYSKDISAPQSDGTYWIKLESFATGSAAKIISSTPSDIILVLDSSSSMDNRDYTEVTYSARDNNAYSYNSYPSNNNNRYYYLYNGKHYVVSRGSSGGTYYLSFTANETTYYLSDEGPTTTLSGASSNSGTIWSGVLYNRSSQTVERITALKNATRQFIANIAQNDTDVTAQDPSFAGNRIAIVSYDEVAHVLTSGWVDVGGTNAVTTLNSAVNSMTTANWTRPDLGMAAAISTFLDGSDADHKKRAEANLTVVVFTDGVPCHSSGWGNTFEASDANNAIYQGHRLKHDYGAKLFTVGLISPTSTDNNIRCGRYFLELLSSNYPDSYIAQNSTSAWNVSGNGTITVNNLTVGTKDSKGNYYQLVDGDTDLSSIFDAISKQSGGSASELSASSRNVDVVSNSFIIPGATSENINTKVKIFIAKVNGYNPTTKEFSFEEEFLKGHYPNDNVSDITGYYYYPLDENGNHNGPLKLVDADIEVGYNETTQAVTVTGFDYGSCFCGPIFENYTPSNPPVAEDYNHVHHYQGYKIIIMIPIEMNPNAVGGPDCPTNAPGSGIFINNQDTQGLVQFKSPKVSLPVNIHLEKTGLGAGESAKFRIDRAQLPDPIPDNFNPATYYQESDWSYVSTVFVTKPQGSTASDPEPVVKVRGLPANVDVTTGTGESAVTVHKSFVYRVTEENWSWSYTAQTPPQYTTTSNVTNPFTFSNDKKDNIDFEIRHAESKATNVFKPGIVTNNVKYDDSKPRTTASQ